MRYKSEICEVIHQGAVKMLAIGGITADEMCLVLEPETVKETPETVDVVCVVSG